MTARVCIPRRRVWCPAALTVLVATACGTDAGSAPSSDPFCASALARVDSFSATLGALPTAGRGGTVTAAVLNDLEGFNSLATTEYESRQHQIYVNQMTLVRAGPGPDFDPVPYLAEAWSLSPDGSVLEFTLRDDVFWHDGTPTTAHDVLFTWERAGDEATGFGNGAFFEAYQSGELVDERTIRFVIEPHAMPLDAWRTTAIMPAHLLGEVPPTDLQGHPYGRECPVGNGPFRFASHSTDEAWVFEANPAFPAGLGGPPAADRYVLRIIPDQSTIMNELRSGGIDLYPNMRPDHAESLSNIDGFHVLSFPTLDYSFIAWNTKNEKLADARVRRALTMGIDRQAIVDQLVVGYGTVADHGVPPMLWQFDASLPQLAHDPDEAAQLLDAAGWTDRDGDGVREDADGTPLRIEILIPAGAELRANIVQVAQSDLRRIGVDIQPVSLEFGTLRDRIFPPDRDFEGFMLNYSAEFALNDRDLYHSQSTGNFAWSGLNNPQVDQLIDVLQTPMERSEAAARWSEYQQMIRELSPWTHLYFGDRIAGVADYLEGVSMDVRGEWLSVHDWTVGNR